MILTITSMRLEAILFAKRLRHLSQFSHAATDDPLGHKYVPFLVESSIKSHVAGREIEGACKRAGFGATSNAVHTDIFPLN